ncbi:hypothetical protein HPB49_004415 [Dermacentor silvarum]|uniref:Uncharacterized protein n=1 Tax=Dermacentor silvarum TaxID=543639 RepID=A0ACB8DHZ7_DERSI|nr:hypothetical protein HPB49_004415 [Dermacentor silvarum]
MDGNRLSASRMCQSTDTHRHREATTLRIPDLNLTLATHVPRDAPPLAMLRVMTQSFVLGVQTCLTALKTTAEAVRFRHASSAASLAIYPVFVLNAKVDQVVSLRSTFHNVYILGDFNAQIDWSDPLSPIPLDPVSDSFLEAVESAGFMQLFTESTYSSHTGSSSYLDLCFTLNLTLLLECSTAAALATSDHSAFICSHVTYSAPYLRLTRAESEWLEASLRKAYKTALGLPMSTATHKLKPLGISNTMSELMEATPTAQYEWLPLTHGGRTVLQQVGI